MRLTAGVPADQGPLRTPSLRSLEPRQRNHSSRTQASLLLPRKETGKRPVLRGRQAFGGLSEKALEQAELFRSRLTKRARHLRRWPTRQGITCYRLYDRDIPEIPLIVDRYEDCLHIAEYERPHDRTRAEHADWLDLMKRTAADTLGLELPNTFLKHRRRQRGESQYERFGEQHRTCLVSEGGLRFEVNLSDYLDTGLFLDHRITRGMVREAAAGKRFLNLFGYTGSFTVYAAAGGAKSTTTVDLSNTYLEWAQRNMTLNQLAGHEHRFVRDDAMSFLRAHPCLPSYDLARGRPADVLQQQDDRGLLRHPARSRRTPQPACGTDDARRARLLLLELPPLQAGRGASPRGDDPRDQPPDGPARLPQRADPSDVENHPRSAPGFLSDRLGRMRSVREAMSYCSITGATRMPRLRGNAVKHFCPRKIGVFTFG